MKRLILSPLLLLPFLSYSQCTGLRNGTVFTRSPDKHEPYRITINGPILIQTNLVTSDSTVWNIHWVDSCGFIMRFISGNDSLKKAQQYYLKKHTIALKIDEVTANYYLYKAYRDRIGHRQYARDTLWMQPH
ncbi:MAG: hypothetical protein JST68_19470 [Bacteroidetes bacterium]|nr:hypothetical protein [Bacteroidota bacterium]